MGRDKFSNFVHERVLSSLTLKLLSLSAAAVLLGYSSHALRHWLFIHPIEKSFTLEAQPYWIGGETGKAFVRPTFVSPVGKFEGLTTDVNGNFDASLHARGLNLSSVSDIMVVDRQLDSVVNLDVVWPADLGIEPSKGHEQIRLYLSVKAPLSGDPFMNSYDVKGPKSAERATTSAASVGAPSMHLNIPPGREFSFAFVRTKVGELPGNSIPAEYIYTGPPFVGAIAGTGVSELDSVTTVVFKHNSPDSTADSGSSIDVEINCTSLTGLVEDGRLNIGNESRNGQMGFVVPSVSKPISIDANTSTQSTPYQFVITPHVHANSKWTIHMHGSLKRLALTPICGNMNIGTQKLSFGSADIVELSGTMAVSLAFNPPQFPVLRIVGSVNAVVFNGEQILDTQWQSLSEEIRGALIGAIVGGLVGFLLAVFSSRLKRRLTN